MAQRIILELKDKVESSQATLQIGQNSFTKMPKGNATAAINALSVLGYSQSEAAAAVSKFDDNMAVEDLIKNALKSMARRA